MQTVEKFIQLGQILADFGHDDISHKVVERAVADNDWFSPRDITSAVEAVAQEMLTRSNLEEWLAHYPNRPVTTPRRVLIFMAGNIPAVGFADLLCVLAAGHSALVKYSSRDTALMQYLVGILAKDFSIQQYRPETDSPQALLAMGSDSTAQILHEQFGDIPCLIRSSRNSVAILTGNESDCELKALCEDIVRYDGRGCRSVSQMLIPEGYNFTPLTKALSEAEVSSKWRATYIHNRALGIMSGQKMIDAGCMLLSECDTPPMNIATIHYTVYNSADSIESWIAERDTSIQCIVAKDFVHPRCVPFGRAQHPTLTDYPDGIDTMKWLLSL